MVEVLVAATILGVTVIAVFGAMRTCSAAAHHMRMLTKAVLLAETQLVQTKLAEPRSFETKEGRMDRYRWKVRIAPTPVDNLGAIRVQVKWLEQQRKQQYELFSLIRMKAYAESD